VNPALGEAAAPVAALRKVTVNPLAVRFVTAHVRLDVPSGHMSMLYRRSGEICGSAFSVISKTAVALVETPEMTPVVTGSPEIELPERATFISPNTIDCDGMASNPILLFFLF